MNAMLARPQRNQTDLRRCPRDCSLSSGQDSGWWRRTFTNQNLTAYAKAGWLFYNSNYFARPNNTGRTLFRYVAHADLDLYKNRLVPYGDMNFFTDRDAGNTLSPTELDRILGIAVRWKDLELAIYREEDRPLDQSGLVRKYYAVQLRWHSMCRRRLGRTGLSR